MDSLLFFKILTIFFSPILAEYKSYEGYKVIRVPVRDNSTMQYLMSIYYDSDFDFWTVPALGRQADIMVPPEHLDQFLDYLDRHNISYTIMMDDVQKAVDAEMTHHTRTRTRQASGITFDKFYSFDEIASYLKYLAMNFPHLVTAWDLGKSVEGRSIYLVKVSKSGPNKPAIFMDGTIHAREWISASTTLYIIHQLVERYEENRDLVENLDWYFIPVLNPDGYNYTFTQDRFWRKNRAFNRDSDCVGVDLNRNFDYHWGGTGSSNDACTQTYRGPRAFSEPESRILRDTILALRGKVRLYITFHSAAQMILYPWGFTKSMPTDWTKLDRLAHRVANQIESVRGTKYRVGSSAVILAHSSGSSRDWARGVAGVKYSYTFELPSMTFGFDLPPREIAGVVEETFEGIRVFANFIQLHSLRK